MSTIWMLWRILAFVALSFLAYKIFMRAIAQSSPIGMAGFLLFAAAAMILGAIILSPDLAKLAARPFTSFIDSIYLPGGREKKPPLDYRKADLHRKRAQYEKAEEAYGEIIHFYPEELRAYMSMVEVYLELEDPKAAEIILAKAHRKLRHNEKAVKEIELTRQRVIESAKSEPEMG